jgi:signal transduction histidine kinase
VKVLTHQIDQPVLIFSKIGDISNKIQKELNLLGIPKSLLPKVESIGDYLSQKKSFIFFFHEDYSNLTSEKFIHLCKDDQKLPPLLIKIGKNQNGYLDAKRLGFDRYLPENFESEEFSFMMEELFEIQYLRSIQENMLILNGFKTRYNTKLIYDPKDNEAKFLAYKLLIYNISTSLSQGSGIGTAISLIDMLKSTSEIQEDKVIVDKEILDMLLENNQYSRFILDGLQNTYKLLESELNLVEVNSDRLVTVIKKVKEDLSNQLSLKNIFVQISEDIPKVQLSIDSERMNLIFEELFINAYKFSVTNSSIDVSFKKDKNNFIIDIYNIYESSVYTGIPEDLEKIIIEPFIRNYPPIEEILITNRFGLGLGLTAIDFLVYKHNGKFRIKNKTSNDGKSSIHTEIQLPIR